ncbi:hypothetical protein K2W90_05830 [Candidatus Babeliales bacterium]|nr:hypothetical protein [Candidatus Babeliales bacterium]
MNKVILPALLVSLLACVHCYGVRRSLEQQRKNLSNELHIVPEAQVKIEKSEQKDQLFLAEARKLKVSERVLEELKSGDASLRLQRKRWILYKQKEKAQQELLHAQQAVVTAQEHLKKLQAEWQEKQQKTGTPHATNAVQQAAVFVDPYEECIFSWQEQLAYAHKRVERAAERFHKSELAYRAQFLTVPSQKELLQRQYEQHRDKGRVRWWHRLPILGKRAREEAVFHRQLAQQMVRDRAQEKTTKIMP